MRNLNKIICLILLLFSVTTAAMDNTVVDKLKAEAEKGDAAALAELKAGAENGDAVYEVAYIEAFNNQPGIKQDYQQAFLWYKKAADQGNAQGELRLGGMYDGNSCQCPDTVVLCPEECAGIKADHAKAFKLYKKAADQWDPDALQRLGDYYNGAGGVVHRNKIISYALYASSSNIGEDVESTDWHLSKAQIKTAEALKQRMTKIGVSAAIDEYLKSVHESK